MIPIIIAFPFLSLVTNRICILHLTCHQEAWQGPENLRHICNAEYILMLTQQTLQMIPMLSQILQLMSMSQLKVTMLPLLWTNRSNDK